MHHNQLQELLKHRLPDPTSRVSDCVVLGWDLKICIFNQFPGDTDVAGPRITFSESPLHDAEIQGFDCIGKTSFKWKQMSTSYVMAPSSVEL